jgi:hypothetical protein
MANTSKQLILLNNCVSRHKKYPEMRNKYNKTAAMVGTQTRKNTCNSNPITRKNHNSNSYIPKTKLDETSRSFQIHKKTSRKPEKTYNSAHERHPQAENHHIDPRFPTPFIVEARRFCRPTQKLSPF